MQDKQTKICAISTISKTMEWFMVDTMRALAKEGYDVTLICNMEPGFAEKNSDFAKCISLPMARGASLSDLLKSTKELKKIFKREKFRLYYGCMVVVLYSTLRRILLPKVNFCIKFLQICIICCTFARNFVLKYAVFRCTFDIFLFGRMATRLV